MTNFVLVVLQHGADGLQDVHWWQHIEILLEPCIQLPNIMTLTQQSVPDNLKRAGFNNRWKRAIAVLLTDQCLQTTTGTILSHNDRLVKCGSNGQNLVVE